MSAFRLVAGALCAAAIAQLAGCASFEFTKPLPEQKQPVTVTVSREGLSGMNDLPLGVYRVPDSQVIISGHQTGQAGALLFGLVGVALVHAGNASAGAQAVKDAEQRLKIDMVAPVTAALRTALDAGQMGPQFSDQPGAGKRLVLTPALVMSFVGDKDVRPYVVVRADLAGADGGQPEWKGRYIASSGESRPLAGPGGWLEGDGGLLQATVRRNIDLVVRTLATDIRSPYRRDEAKLSAVEASFPFVKPRLQTVGFLLAEDEHHYTYVPRLGDVIVFSGVNVLDRSSTQLKPATKEDPPLKMVEPAKK